MTEGGRLVNSFEPLLEGLHDLVGDILPLEAYGFALSGGIMLGAVSTIDGARECDDVTVGWYDLRGVVYNLTTTSGKHCSVCDFFSSLDKGDVAGFLRDIRLEGPAGMTGSSTCISAPAGSDFRNLRPDSGVVFPELDSAFAASTSLTISKDFRYS